MTVGMLLTSVDIAAVALAEAIRTRSVLMQDATGLYAEYYHTPQGALYHAKVEQIHELDRQVLRLRNELIEACAQGRKET